jgi:hypothetical protein
MSDPNQKYPWSPIARFVASILILGYLAIVVLGPLTNPIGAPQLTTPLARTVSPVHQAMFLGHGYRFFGPDPGPTHSLIFKVNQADGSTIEGHFPDRNNTVPRLLYHRWFMLSESLFRECSEIPSDDDVAGRLKDYQTGIDAFLEQGKVSLSSQLTQERDAAVRQLAAAKQRRDLLVESVAKVLLERHSGQSVELGIQTRTQPTPEETVSGMRLLDESLISRVSIGTYDGTALKIPSEPELESIESVEATDE